jgi:hypothetical protein
MDSGKLRLIRFARTALALTAAALLLWATLFGVNLRRRFRAQSVVMALRSMQVGSTTLEEAQPILARYAAGTLPASFTSAYSADYGFWIGESNPIPDRLTDRFYFLRYLGLALWESDTEMYFRNGRLCLLRFSVWTEVTRKQEFRQGFRLETTQSLGQKEFVMSGGAVTGGHQYIFFGIHDVRLPADATPAERTHAFGYDLSCVTALGGCRDVSQILPYRSVRSDFDARHPN